MALNTKIFDALRNSTAISALTGTRIYPVMVPQDNVTFPAVIYTKVSADGFYSLSGFSGKERARYGIDIISTDHDQARTIADAVHTAMTSSTAFACIRVSDGDAYDADFEIFLVNQIYSIIGGT
jgi:hypothetical protein